MPRFLHSLAFGRLLAFVAVAILLGLVFAPFAFAQASSTVVDLTPFVAELRNYLLTLIVILANVGLGYVVRYFNLAGSEKARRIEELTRDFVHATADRGLTLALSKVQPHLQAVDVRSQIAAEAIEYVRVQAPDALKRLNVDPAGLGRLVQAKLSEVLPYPGAPLVDRSPIGFPIGAGPAKS